MAKSKMFPFGLVKKMFTGKKAKARRAKPRSNVRNQLVSVKKTAIYSKIVVNTQLAPAPVQFGSDTFSLSDLPQYASYVALYEEYRIDKIVYSFKALCNSANVGVETGSSLFCTNGMIHTIIDYNDATYATTIQDMMNDETYKGTVSTRNHTRTFKPRFLNEIQGSKPVQQGTGWLLTSNVFIDHYAIKWAFEPGYTNQATGVMVNYVVEPIVTFYVSFRNPK